jgi:Fe-S-cluster containining protein
VYLDDEEIGDLAQHLGLSEAEFRERYTFRDELGWTQLAGIEARCVFLDPKTKLCGVYAARPTQCRTFPFWRRAIRDGDWTPEVRELCEGVGRGPSHSLEYAQARMLEMEESAED